MNDQDKKGDDDSDATDNGNEAEEPVFHVLRIQCPVCGKPDDEPSFWYHEKDNAQTEISQYAMIRCKNGCTFAFIDCEWKCDTKQHEYAKADKIKMAAIIGKMMKLKYTDEEEYEWVATLNYNIMAQFKKKR